MIRYILNLCIFLICCATAWAGGNSEAPITVAYPRSVSSIPIMDVIEENPDLYSGVQYTDHAQALGQLINGEIDILASGFAVGHNRYLTTGDIQLIDTLVWGVSSLMTSPEIQSLEQLAGGTLYIPFPNSPIDLQFKALLSQFNLLNEIRIEYAPFPQAAALLSQGKAEGAVLVEPIASKLETAAVARRLMTIQEAYAEISLGEQRSPQVSLFKLQDNSEISSQQIVQFRTHLGASVLNLVGNYEAASVRFAPNFELPPAVLKQSLQNSIFAQFEIDEQKRLITLYANQLGLENPDEVFYFSE